jgi:hypothetical protein
VQAMTHISEDSYPLSWSNLPFKLPLLPFHWNMLRKEEIEEFIRLSIEYERTKVRRDTLEQCAQLLECGFMQSWADKFRDMKP